MGNHHTKACPQNGRHRVSFTMEACGDAVLSKARSFRIASVQRWVGRWKWSSQRRIAPRSSCRRFKDSAVLEFEWMHLGDEACIPMKAPSRWESSSLSLAMRIQHDARGMLYSAYAGLTAPSPSLPLPSSLAWSISCPSLVSPLLLCSVGQINLLGCGLDSRSAFIAAFAHTPHLHL